MIDRQGNLVPVPAHQASSAYQSGQLTFTKEPIHVVVDGETHTVAPEKAAHFFANAPEARIATDQEVHEHELEKKFGGALGHVAAAGEGAARGLTLGLSDPLAVGVGRLIGGEETAEKVRTHLKEVKEAHPLLSTGAEIAGSVAPILATGGEGAAVEGANLARAGAEGAEEASVIARLAEGAKGLGAIPAGVDTLGHAAEHVVSHMLGATAETALGRAAQQAAKTAVHSLVVGSLFGAGETISESTLENQPLTAEKLLTNVGHAALMAGVLGGGIGAASSLVGEATTKLLGKLGPTLEDAAADQSFASLDAKGASEGAIKRAGGRTDIGRVWLDEVNKVVEEKGVTAAAMTNGQKLAIARDALDRAGQTIGDRVATSDASVKLADMLKPIDERIGEFSGKVGQQGVVNRLQAIRDDLVRIAGPDVEQVGIKDLIQQKRSLQQLAYQATKTLNPSEPVQQLREVTGAWNELMEKSMNEAGKGTEGTELRALNKRYQQLQVVNDILEHNEVRYARTDTFSLTAKMAGASSLAGGLASAHPASALASLPMTLGAQALKDHGNMAAAILLDRLSTYGGVARAVAEENSAVDAAIDSFMAQKTAKPARALKAVELPEVPHPFKVGAAASSEKTRERYEQESDRVRRMASIAPAVVSAHLEDKTRTLSAHAPNLAQAMQQQAMRANEFLVSKLPPVSHENSLTPQLNKEQTNSTDMQKFLRYVDAVNSGPVGVLKKVAKGSITQEDVETLKAVYPQQYDEIRSKVIQKCAEAKEPLPYQARLKLGTLFDFTTDPTMTPEFRTVVQESYMPKPAQGQGPRGGPPPIPARAPKELFLSQATKDPYEAVISQ